MLNPSPNRSNNIRWPAIAFILAFSGLHLGVVAASEEKAGSPKKAPQIVIQTGVKGRVPVSSCFGDKSRCEGLTETLERRNQRIRKSCIQDPERCKRRKEKRISQRRNAIRVCSQQPERCYKGEQSVLKRRKMLNEYIESNSTSD